MRTEQVAGVLIHVQRYMNYQWAILFQFIYNNPYL